MHLTDTERRALQVLATGNVQYHVSGPKPIDWNKEEWKFNIATLRALQDLDLADYVIMASCQRTWSLTIDGRKLCIKFGWLSPP